MKVEINEILTNGLIDSIKSDNRIVAFILGALDNGFQVKMDGVIIAKKSKLEIFIHRQGENKTVQFFKGEENILEKPLDKFYWGYLKNTKGRIYYNDKFICTTT